jgi:hypothetical protein
MGKIIYLAAVVISSINWTVDASAQVPTNQSGLELIQTPSRNVAPDELEIYIQSVASKLLINGQLTDPFGLAQEPQKQGITGENEQQIQSPVSIPLADVIKLVPVNMVIPKQQTFRMGNREVKLGDTLPFTLNGAVVKTQVTEINSLRIAFKNVSTGEVAYRDLNSLPPGMSYGVTNKMIGKSPTAPDQPIELVVPDETKQ